MNGSPKLTSLINLLKSIQLDPHFQPVVSILPEFIFQIDRQGIFLDLYAVNSRQLFAPAGSVIGNSIQNLFPSSFAHLALESIAQSLQTQHEVAFEYSLNLEGSLHHFEGKVIPGNEGLVTIFVNDITRKKQIELKLLERSQLAEESEQKFRLLAENLPGAVYLCRNDAQYSMLYLNDRVQAITGYLPSEFISGTINFPQLYHPEDTEKIYQQVDDCIAGKKPFHLVYRIKHRSGEYRWMEEFGSGVFVANELVYLEGYLQDITTRKETEKKILENNKALQKANEELDRFVYSASHDLRSPLTSLLGLIDLASRSTSPEDTQMLLKLMKERVDSLDRFIIDITSYAENERLELQVNKINLYNLARDCFDAIRYAEDAAGVDFELLVPMNFQLAADQRRLKVVLGNLFSNSIKYSDRNKAEKYLKVEVEDHASEYHIIVTDNGIGITTDHQSKVFNMFYRASEKSKGSGLGLYIVKETIQKMNGSLLLISELGKGSEFRIKLPKTH